MTPAPGRLHPALPAHRRAVTFPFPGLCVHIPGWGAGRRDVDKGLAAAAGCG